jgi:hypothetical protein
MTATTAVDMAKQAEIDPKKFRRALRSERFRWHNFKDRWTVEPGSKERTAMQKVLDKLSN